MNKKILLHSCCGPCSIMCLEYLQENNFTPEIFYYNPNIHPQKEYYLRLCAMQSVAKLYNAPLIIGNNKEFFEKAKQEQKTLNTAWIKENKQQLFSAHAGSTKNAETMKQAVQKILQKWQNYAELFPHAGFDGLYVFYENRLLQNPDEETLRSLLTIDSYVFVRHLADYTEKKRCRECYKERMTRSVLYAKDRGYEEFTSTLLYSKYQDHDDICQAAENAVSLANKTDNDGSSRSIPLHFHYVDFRRFWQQGIDKSKELNIYRQKWCGCILSRLDSLEQMAVREYEKLLKKQKTMQNA